MDKPRIVKDYEKLLPDIQEQIKLAYPYGFAKNLIRYKNISGQYVSALPFETDEKYYLVRMTLEEAKEIIYQDNDYDDSGELKQDVKDDYEEKHGSLEEIIDSEDEPADTEGNPDGDSEF